MMLFVMNSQSWHLGAAVAVTVVLGFSAGCAGCLTRNPNPVCRDHIYYCAEYLQKGALDQAEARCELALELCPASPEVYNLLGLIARKRGLLDVATDLFKRAIAVRDDFADALNNLGEIFMERRDYDNACDLFDQAKATDPNFVIARANLANCLYHKKNVKLAAKEYLKCTEQDPGMCDCRLGLGVIAADDKDLQAAEEHFKRATVACPDRAAGFYYLCWTYLSLRRCTQAVASCSRALAIHPNYVEAREAQAEAALCVASTNATLEELIAKVERNPRDPKLHYDLGCRLEDNNRWADALSEFRRTVVLDAGHALAHFRAARVAERLMQPAQTVAHCEAFMDRLRGDNHEEERKWCIERLRQLKTQ